MQNSKGNLGGRKTFTGWTEWIWIFPDFNTIRHEEETHRSFVCSSSAAGTLRLAKVSFHTKKNPSTACQKICANNFQPQSVCLHIICYECVGDVCMYVCMYNHLYVHMYVCMCLCGSVYKCVRPVAISGSAPFSTFPGNLFPWRFVYGYKEPPESEAKAYSEHTLSRTTWKRTSLLKYHGVKTA